MGFFLAATNVFVLTNNASRFESLPHILRFSVHLALFLRQIGFILPEADVNYVIKGFTRILIKESKVGVSYLLTGHSHMMCRRTL